MVDSRSSHFSSFAPPLGDQGPSLYTNPYHDQDAWYSDCILSNRLSSDFLLILDYDEYPMLDFDHTIKNTISQQWTRFLDSLPPDRGSFEMTRIPMSAEVTHGKPDPSKLIQDELQCVHGSDRKVKSFYRAKTVMTANQHKKTVGFLISLSPFISFRRLQTDIDGFAAYVPIRRRACQGI